MVPTPALVSGSPERRALARSVAAIIGCDIHPLHNVSVLNKLRAAGHDDEFVSRWIKDWIAEGFTAVEPLIGDSGWALSSIPGLADVYLIPQIYAARRFGLDVTGWFPKIARLELLAEKHPAFQRAHPSNQIDTPIFRITARISWVRLSLAVIIGGLSAAFSSCAKSVPAPH